MKLAIDYSQKKGYTLQTSGFKVTARDAKEAVEKLVTEFRSEVQKCLGIEQ